MAGIQITVAELRPPAPGKKQYKLVDSTGKQWGVWADKANLYQIGQSYVVEKYKTNQFQGNTYYTIEEAAPLSTANGQGNVQRVEPRVQAPPPQAIGVTLKDEIIFIAGQMNYAMSNPNVNPFSITTVERIKFINDCRTAWRNTFGKRQGDDEMSDEIPY